MLSSMVVLFFALFTALASAGHGDAMPLVLADASLSLEDGIGEAEMLVDSEGWQVVPEEVARVWQQQLTFIMANVLKAFQIVVPRE